MTPEQLRAHLIHMESAGYVKVKRSLGTWQVQLTKRGRAAMEVAADATAPAGHPEFN
ncbi:MAG TPA: hypothetical protein VHB02_06130 [Acidimicrobiales bacterium]|nr:hypothetical protein [Acidimicrobiales bacterium]